MEPILTDASVSISELQGNASAVIDANYGEPVAILVHDRPRAYLVPAATYKRMLDRLDVLELVELVRARTNERRVKVRLDDL